MEEYTVTVSVSLCDCTPCDTFREAEPNEAADDFDLTDYLFPFHFPRIQEERGSGDHLAINVNVVADVFESIMFPGSTVRQPDKSAEVVRFLTYKNMDGQDGPERILPLVSLASMYEYLHDDKLDDLITLDETATDFLRRVCMLFVYCWHAFTHGHPEAELTARKFRRILGSVLSHSVISNQVVSTFTSETFWPVVGPLQILEMLVTQHLFCIDTVMLLCNLTRITGFPQVLNRASSCVNVIKEQFLGVARRINQADELGGLLLHLMVNLMSLSGFPRFVIESDDGYFLKVVMADLITKAELSETMRVVLWPFLKNLSIVDEGRQLMMDHLDDFLGPILYQIAGPEEMTAEEMGNLPLEVQFLGSTKRRNENKNIRLCILEILYSLCRFKNDRIRIRDADVYQILRHYHAAETDPILIEKIEDLVNILIRRENSEIEVDDLLEGLHLQPRIRDVREEPQAPVEAGDAPSVEAEAAAASVEAAPSTSNEPAAAATPNEETAS